jgi:hypothetical protein
MPVYMYACMCLDVRCGQTMRFDVCAATPFDACRVRCQVRRFDVCSARRSMPCEGSDEVSNPVYVYDKDLQQSRIPSTPSLCLDPGGSRSQTHRRAAMCGFTQNDGYVRGVAPTQDSFSGSFSNLCNFWRLRPVLELSP